MTMTVFAKFFLKMAGRKKPACFSFPVFVILASLCFVGNAGADVITVGPGESVSSLHQVGWDKLKPDDEVRIKAKETPYREKIILKRSGTRKKRIRITGIPDRDGRLPVIDGSNAVHFMTSTDVLLSRRAIIIVGGSRSEDKADFVEIRNLELRNANNTNFFYQKKQRVKYADNGAGIYVQRGKNVVVKNCRIHACCMGVQTAYYPEVDNFVLTGNLIYNNGDFTKTHWAHNVYLSAGKSLVEFNRFGELVSDGNNIKDRSGLTVIRYNWIEGGMSRQIDLVETKKYPSADAYVYGNVIISGKKTKNPKMVLFGGDMGEHSSRNGTLYFFNNTLHFRKKKLDGFVWVNRPNCRAVLNNNIFLGGHAVWIGNGFITGFNNLVEFGANQAGLRNCYMGGIEQIMNRNGISYFPRPGSLLINNGSFAIPARVRYMPLPIPGEKSQRPRVGKIDIGAYEFF